MRKTQDEYEIKPVKEVIKNFIEQHSDQLAVWGCFAIILAMFIGLIVYAGREINIHGEIVDMTYHPETTYVKKQYNAATKTYQRRTIADPEKWVFNVQKLESGKSKTINVSQEAFLNLNIGDTIRFHSKMSRMLKRKSNIKTNQDIRDGNAGISF